MSYKTYRGKSKARRHELREEYERDTGNITRQTQDDQSYAEAMQLLHDMGIPFAPDGTPLGIGWDD